MDQLTCSDSLTLARSLARSLIHCLCRCLYDQITQGTQFHYNFYCNIFLHHTHTQKKKCSLLYPVHSYIICGNGEQKRAIVIWRLEAMTSSSSSSSTGRTNEFVVFRFQLKHFRLAIYERHVNVEARRCYTYVLCSCRVLVSFAFDHVFVIACVCVCAIDTSTITNSGTRENLMLVDDAFVFLFDFFLAMRSARSMVQWNCWHELFVQYNNDADTLLHTIALYDRSD